MFSETYEITFYDKNGYVDSVQQYRNEKEARESLALFHDPLSLEMYSKITLSKTEWHSNAISTILDTFIF